MLEVYANLYIRLFLLVKCHSSATKLCIFLSTQVKLRIFFSRKFVFCENGYNAHTMLPASCRQHRGCIIPHAVTQILVLLKIGKIISRNMLR